MLVRFLGANLLYVHAGMSVLSGDCLAYLVMHGLMVTDSK